MKHAIVGPKGRIQRVLDAAPKHRESVEITSKQAKEIEALAAQKQPALLIDGVVKSVADVRADNAKVRLAEHKARFAERQAQRPYADRRRDAYAEAGATIEALTVALWEKSEGMPDAFDALQAARAEIKKQIPKV
tara:strand:- start:715 stop:1119 length:405 start_codon:yes stop_codon:yes gene_type:complete